MKINNLNLSEKYIPIVLCAGFGTRLQPLTKFIPKVICPIINKPLAFYNIEQFLKFGFEKVYCNTHYKHTYVEQEIKLCARQFGYDESRIEFIYEPEILETGGGIKNIFEILCELNAANRHKDCVVVSGDIVCDFPLKDMLNRWENRTLDELALMVSLPMKTMRTDAMWVSQSLEYVTGFGSGHEFKDSVARLFSNHQIISSDIVASSQIKKESSVQMFYKKLLNGHKKIIHMNMPENAYWFNVGTFQEYQDCLKFFCAHQNKTFPPINKLYFEEPNFKEYLKSLEYGDNDVPNQSILFSFGTSAHALKHKILTLPPENHKSDPSGAFIFLS